jgi:hypothetical protein
MLWPAALVLLLASAPASDAAPAPPADRPVRVLLLTDAPTREYQFLRTLVAREADRKKATLTVYVQPPPGKAPREGIVADVPAERMLKRFPARFEPGAKDLPHERPDNLASYDVVVAFDFDWLRLKPEEVRRLSKWVAAGGGLVVVAGPVHTPALARPKTRAQARAALELWPVQPGEPVGDEAEADTSRPWALHFPTRGDGAPFLKLDPAGVGPLAGWRGFFVEKKDDREARGGELLRGFFHAYPVRAVKPGATVVATLANPKAKTAGDKERPFLVTMARGKGRVVYLGSGETWRLRQYREAYHENFWRQLLAYAARMAG